MTRKPKKIKLHSVAQYATDVTTGKILANKLVKLACKRHLQDLKTGAKQGLHFDESAANHIIAFFEEFLIFYEGEFDGKPFILQPWQKFIIGSLFGWKTKDGYRRFRTAYCEISKGAGKSPMAAGIGLYGLIFDGENGAEIYSAATTREQAGILFRDAKAFADGSPELKELLIVDKHNIAYEATNSFFRPVSSEHRGLDGKRPHIALIDEIHEHPNAMVVDKIRAGTKGRREALIFEITNSGYDRHSICFQHHEYTEKILEGIIKNDAWFGYITGLDVCLKCEAEGKTIPQDGCPDCDDWRDEKVWSKANVNLGVSIKKKYLQEQVNEAKEMPSKENIVKRLNFNIWTESITKWLPVDVWNACTFHVEPEELKGRTCYGGLDLSSTTDVTAWVKVFPPIESGIISCLRCGFRDDRKNIRSQDFSFEDSNKDGPYLVCPNCIKDFKRMKKGIWKASEILKAELKPDSKYEILCDFFLPEDNMAERVRRDKVPYDVWARQGYITLTPGNIIDYAFIIAQIQRDMADYQIAELAFDRWGSQKITTDLQELGFEIEGKRSLIQFGQGFASMSPPTKEVEKMVLSKELAHGGNPVLTWMVSNVAIKIDPAENKKPDKEKSIERIDGVVALIMAVGRAMLKGGITKSAYEGLTVDEIKARMVF